MRRFGRFATTWGAIALLGAIGITPAAAQPAADVIAALGDVQNAVVQAALETYRGEQDQALLTLDQALMTLETLRDSLTDPALARGLTGKVRAAQAKATKARKAIAAGKYITIQLNKLRVAAKIALAAALKAGHPVLGELDARSAGFHEPGDEVRLQIYAADGSICIEPPVVGVVNDSLGSSVDLGSVVVDETTGIVSLTMGPDQGGVRVTVTACGQSATVLLYNYGPKPPKGLPKRFPINLPPGTYQMTVSGQVAGVGIPATVVGTFTLDEITIFARDIVAAFRQAAGAAAGIPGCGMSVRYSGYDGSGFSITLRIHCSVAGYSVSGNLTFRVDRL